MFDVYDIVSIGTILIILFFLFIIFQIEKSFSKPRLYLRIVLLLALFVIIIGELIALEQYSLISWLYPLYIACYFAIYPMVYIYSRNLVHDDKKNSTKLIYIFLLPFAVLVYLSIIFYALDYDSKIRFMSLHLSQSSPDLKGYTVYQYVILITYYAQTIFYISVTFRLIYAAGGNPFRWSKKRDGNPWKLLLVKYLLIYVVAVIVYEVFVAYTSVLFADNVTVIHVSEMLLSLLFVSMGLYIALKQSIIVIQSKIYKYSNKLSLLSAGSNEAHAIDGTKDFEIKADNSNKEGGINNPLGNPVNEKLLNKNLLSDDEKREIKEAIENYLTDSKIYLDPNLKLGQLAKKIYIPSRKISFVINEVFGSNFNHFINDFRISEAKKIISRNPRNVIIENIYTKVGFNSRSSFNRVFKNITGITPFDYIKSLLETKTGEVSQ